MACVVTRITPDHIKPLHLLSNRPDLGGFCPHRHASGPLSCRRRAGYRPPSEVPMLRRRSLSPARVRSLRPVARILAGLATTVVVAGLSLATTAEAAPPEAAPVSVAVPAAAAGPGGFTAVVPTRVLDTRTGVGAARSRVAAWATLTAKVTGVGAVPASGVSAV